jgi:HEAT repeat protein
VQATAALIGLEPAAPEGSARTAYGIVLRRILTKEALKRVAHLLPDPRFTPVATAVMQRGGAEGAEVLVDLVSGSEVPRERRAYLAALRVIPHGTEAVVQLLSTYQWFVVRNVAELLGEMRVEEAVPSLGGLLGHKEPRVRRAAAVALARIGTVATVEPLRRALREGTPELRGLIAASIGGAHARALAMPLVAIAEAEESGDVQAELFRALGRIGTPEAIDALVRAAQPGGRLFGRRPSGPRVAAVEGLRDAGGAAAHRALETLTDDADKVVREAAVRGLAASADGATARPDA